jgi:hypothetical protein
VDRQQNNVSRSIYEDKHSPAASKRAEQHEKEREPRRE